MKHLLLLLCLLSVYSLQAIDNNVELLANNDFSNPDLFANQASLAVDDTPGKWFAGNVEQFTTSIATGAFECSSVAGATFYDYFLGQITSDATVNTGRYHFSINASGNQPFYIKISSVNALGTELSYSLKNASAPAIEKQASPDYAGYSLKVTPTGTSVTYSADLDLQNATPSALRIYIVFPNVGNVTVDDVSFMRTADVPTYTTFYVRPASDNTSWTSLTGIDPDQIVTSNSPTIVGTNTYYFAKGTYTLAGVTVTTGKIYGGFSGNETSINLTQRALSDKDGNGIIEPWEMTNETVINGTHPISGAVTSARLITVTGGEINGLTIQDHHCSNLGAVLLGVVASAPTAAQDIDENAGEMIYCTVRKIKSTANAPIMSTNKSSLIDYCLIEECSSTSTSTGATGAIFFNAFGGRLSNSVIRNNQATAAGTNTRGGAIRSTTTSGDMNVIIENCVIYNNTSGGPGGAIRSDGVASKRGIQIINCTLVNNKTTTATNTGSIDMVNGGLVVNSIVVNDPQHEIRANSTNNYISNNAYGTYTGSTAYPNTNMEAGKTAADFNFVSYSIFQGAMQPGDVGFDQATYDAIRASNFKITAAASAAVTTPGLKTLPSSYLIGGTGGSVALTATIPTTDITGTTRNPSYNYDLGAYQLSGPLTALTNDNEISKSAIFAFENEIIVSNAKGTSIAVYSVTGQLLKSINANSDRVSITADKGIYIVRVGAKVAKVLLK